MNYQPLLLTCECGYRTPEAGSNGLQLSEARARAVFNRHKCAKHVPAQPAEVPCPQCGVPRLIKRTNDYKRRVCKNCFAKRWQLIITERHQELDEMAVERILMASPVISTRAERQAAVAYLAERGLSGRQIARRTGMSARTVQRLKARVAKEDVAA